MNLKEGRKGIALKTHVRRVAGTQTGVRHEGWRHEAVITVERAEHWAGSL
jgi:hypothetical protein